MIKILKTIIGGILASALVVASIRCVGFVSHYLAIAFLFLDEKCKALFSVLTDWKASLAFAVCMTILLIVAVYVIKPFGKKVKSKFKKDET